MNPIILIIAAGALLMHYSKKPTKQNTVIAPTGGILNTQTNHGTRFDYTTPVKPPNFAAGYENAQTQALVAEMTLGGSGGGAKPLLMDGMTFDGAGGGAKPLLASQEFSAMDAGFAKPLRLN